MASPVDSARQATNISTAGTSHSINVGSPVAGTLLVVIVRFASAPGTVTFTGYTQLASSSADASNDETYVFYRKADGTEGATDTLTTSNSVKLCAIGYEITGAADPSIMPPEISTALTGSAANANPPSKAPKASPRDWLIIAALGMDHETATFTAPASHSNLVQANTGTTGTADTNAQLAAASRQQNILLPDPGAWTSTAATTGWTAYTIVVHPPISAYKAEVLADGPVAYYWLDEASGNPQDRSGNANHVTVINGSPTYEQASLIGDANDFSIDFTTDQSFTAPDAAILDVGDVMTLECWLRPDAIGTLQSFATKGSNAMQIRLETNGAVGFRKQAVAQIAASTVQLVNGQTAHVVVTKDGSDTHIYMDGVDVTGTITDQTLASTADALGIGARTSSVPPTEEFEGLIDEYALYNFALSETRIQAHYNAVPKALTLSLSDTVTPTDSLEPSQGHDLPMADTASLSVDSLSLVHGLDISFPDTVALADSLTADLAMLLDLADPLTLSDLFGSQLDQFLDLADTAPLADLLDAPLVIVADFADTLDLSVDVFDALLGQSLDLEDTVGLVDSLNFELPNSLEFSDTAPLADLLDFVFGYDLQLADPVALADSLSRSQDFGLLPTDTVALADAYSDVFGRSLDPVDVVGMVDEISWSESFTLADTVPLSDSLTLVLEVTAVAGKPTLTLKGKAFTYPIPVHAHMLTPDLILKGKASSLIVSMIAVVGKPKLILTGKELRAREPALLVSTPEEITLVPMVCETVTLVPTTPTTEVLVPTTEEFR